MNFKDIQYLLGTQRLKSSPMSPIELFNIRDGIINKNSGAVGEGAFIITIDLEPFIWGSELNTTSIRLDSIDFNGLSFEELGGKSFKFPVNPEKGYIDGSVYIESRHNPIDVTLISFGTRYKELFDHDIPCDDYIEATLLYSRWREIGV